MEGKTIEQFGSFFVHAIAGSCAGIMEHSLMYPIDTIKTHLQVMGHQSLPELYSKGGLRTFFRGLPTLCVGVVPAHISMFGVYEAAKLYSEKSISSPLLGSVFCGLVSTAAHDLVVTPINVLKQRLQLGYYRGGWHCLRSVLSQEGPRALTRSLPITMLMNLPCGALLVPVNEHLKRQLGLHDASSIRQRPWRLSLYFLCAGIAGAVAGAFTNPMDVIKTRMQTQGVTSVVGKGPGVTTKVFVRVRYGGIFTTLLRILEEEGSAALWKGSGARILLSASSAAVCWGTYETAKFVVHKLLGTEFTDEDIALG